jgi:hypothetical protein
MAWAEGGLVELHPIYGEPTTALMRKVTSGLEPFPRPRVGSALIGDRRSSGAAGQTYLSLFDMPATAGANTSAAEWLRVDLRSSRPSPWTDSAPEFTYSPEDDALIRGWHVVELDGATAANLESARALDAKRPVRSLGWALALGGLGALSLAFLSGFARRA